MLGIYDLYEDGRISIDLPLINMTKPEVVQYSRKIGVPLDLAHSTTLSRGSYAQ